MKKLLGAAPMLLISGYVLGCGDVPQPMDESTGREATAVEASAASEQDGVDFDFVDDTESVKTGAGDDSPLDSPADPTYIVYLVPLPSTQLFRDVRAFLDTFQSQATNLPPHVSVTGFFSSNLDPFAAGSVFRRAVESVGTPFGPSPKITSLHCKTVAAESTHPTKGKPAQNWLVDLHVAVTGAKWEQFRSAVINAFNVPKARRRAVKDYHITLFEAPKTSVSQATFKSVCTAAKNAFGANIKNKTYNNASWGTALFERAGAGVVQVPDTGFQVTP